MMTHFPPAKPLQFERAYQQWHATFLDDMERLRYYQRRLLEMRQFSPRPRLSVALNLRQCAAARRMARRAHAVLVDLMRERTYRDWQRKEGER